MIVTGASAGPMLGESPMGTSVLSAAWAPPNSSRTKIQVSIFFVINDRKGDTVVSPLSL